MAVGLALLVLLALCPAVFAQADTQSKTTNSQAKSSSGTDAREKNLREYVALLRTDVRQQKAEIMGSVLELNIDESAKFWPIYSQYDAELTKLNDRRLANIKEYASNYDQMTDEKADELVQGAFEYRKQRGELLAKYYGQVKTSLGAIQAARFLQVEEQLLEIIDLQIAASLPIVGQGS
jgi:hypothetical protein